MDGGRSSSALTIYDIEGGQEGKRCSEDLSRSVEGSVPVSDIATIRQLERKSLWPDGMS
jgi:hypothetical protein